MSKRLELLMFWINIPKNLNESKFEEIIELEEYQKKKGLAEEL